MWWHIYKLKIGHVVKHQYFHVRTASTSVQWNVYSTSFMNSLSFFSTDACFFSWRVIKSYNIHVSSRGYVISWVIIIGGHRAQKPGISVHHFCCTELRGWGWQKNLVNHRIFTRQSSKRGQRWMEVTRPCMYVTLMCKLMHTSQQGLQDRNPTRGLLKTSKYLSLWCLSAF